MMGRGHKGDCEGVARIPKRKVRETYFRSQGQRGQESVTGHGEAKVRTKK